jgi:Leucine-rich repeat (LRR) protein
MKKSGTGILLILLLGVLLQSNAYAAIPREERTALIAFYNATDGDNWKNNSGWREEPIELDGFGYKGRENNWKGVTISNNHVVKIEFSSNHLTGPLPIELAALKHLETLIIVEFSQESDIPPEIGSLERLKELRLVGRFSGVLPGELGELANLEILNLSGNFTGPVPHQLSNLGRLQELYLSGSFTGSIPHELGNLTALQSLHLGGNFSGDIPPEIGNLLNLKTLRIRQQRRLGVTISRTKDGQLTGTLPMELGKLTQLEELSISGGLSGAIPSELGKMTFLKKLSLSNNRFEGNIPPELGNLENLEDLALSRNRLSGPIPPELGNLANLKFLWLNRNQLSGSIPTELGDLGNIQQLLLDGNRLSGEIPANLSSLTGYMIKVGYNALYSQEDMVRSFLDKSDMSWARTQTIPPVNVKAEPASKSSVTVSWKPIPYKADPGCYLVYYGDSPRGPWMLSGKTDTKRQNSFEVTGLKRGRTYYFTVQTQTKPHSNNRNTVTSPYSRDTETIIK